MPAGDGERWARAPRALYRHTLEGALVLGPDTEEPMMLTGPGADVWDILADGATLDVLTDELSRRYEIERARVEADIVPLLDQLVECGLAVTC